MTADWATAHRPCSDHPRWFDLVGDTTGSGSRVSRDTAKALALCADCPFTGVGGDCWQYSADAHLDGVVAAGAMWRAGRPTLPVPPKPKPLASEPVADIAPLVKRLRDYCGSYIRLSSLLQINASHLCQIANEHRGTVYGDTAQTIRKAHALIVGKEAA